MALGSGQRSDASWEHFAQKVIKEESFQSRNHMVYERKVRQFQPLNKVMHIEWRLPTVCTNDLT